MEQGLERKGSVDAVFGFEGMSLEIILDSSMVEHAAVNRGVVGSSPTRGVPRHRKMEYGVPYINTRLRGQAVKTSPFHGGNTGSIPVGVIKRFVCA